MVRTPVILVAVNQFPFDNFKPVCDEKRSNPHAEQCTTPDSLGLFTLVYVAMDSLIDSPLEPWSTTTFEAQYSTMPELPWVEGVTSTVSTS